MYICPCYFLTSSQFTLPLPRVLKSILYVCVKTRLNEIVQKRVQSTEHWVRRECSVRVNWGDGRRKRKMRRGRRAGGGRVERETGWIYRFFLDTCSPRNHLVKDFVGPSWESKSNTEGIKFFKKKKDNYSSIVNWWVDYGCADPSLLSLMTC